MKKPIVNNNPPIRGTLVCKSIVTFIISAKAKMEPAIKARMTTSRVAIWSFASPASTTFFANSAGSRYYIFHLIIIRLDILKSHQLKSIKYYLTSFMIEINQLLKCNLYTNIIFIF